MQYIRIFIFLDKFIYPWLTVYCKNQQDQYTCRQRYRCHVVRVLCPIKKTKNIPGVVYIQYLNISKQLPLIYCQFFNGIVLGCPKNSRKGSYTHFQLSMISLWRVLTHNTRIKSLSRHNSYRYCCRSRGRLKV